MVLYINKIGPRHANNMDNIRLLSIRGVVDNYYSNVRIRFNIFKSIGKVR